MMSATSTSTSSSSSHSSSSPPSFTIDLHGLNKRESEQAVLKTIQDTYHQQSIASSREITINFITGIGNHVAPGQKPGTLYRYLASWLQNEALHGMIKNVVKKYGSYDVILNSNQFYPNEHSPESSTGGMTVEKKIQRYVYRAPKLQWQYQRRRMEKRARKPIRYSDAEKLEHKYLGGGPLKL